MDEGDIKKSEESGKAHKIVEGVESKRMPSYGSSSKFDISKLRDNPWMVSTVVLGIALLLVVAFGGGYGGGGAGSVVSGDVAASNLVSFIESQSQVAGEDDVEVVSAERDGELYKVTLNFQGQDVPVFVSLDGQFLIADVIPLDPSLLPDLPGPGATPTGPVNVEIGGAPFKGEEDAPVVIVEFSDYQCPFCAKFYEDTLPRLEEKFIDNGLVKLVYMDFPLNIHPEASKAAEAARCVGVQLESEGYFEMHDKLFEGQGELSEVNYKKWAREIKGVNGKDFDECLDSGEQAKGVEDSFFYGQTLGVTGTPAFFVNGEFVSGAQPYEVFEEMIVSAIGFPQ